MTKIYIDDEIEEKIEISEEFGYHMFDIYSILNTRELGISVAYKLFDKEKITESDITNAINEVLWDINDEIKNEAYSILKENDIPVKKE